MSESAFTFYRGSAAIMAYDLSSQKWTPGHTQIFGDAHLSNFGVFASPERDLVFDVNDFDETIPGPFEWDVKRLVASFVLAARDRGFKRKEARVEPPLLSRLAITAVYRDRVQKAFSGYRATLQADRRRPLERFHLVDMAQKVVGVGSLGTRAGILLLEGRNAADPLVMQFKQATASVLETYLGASEASQHGQRVVEGQRYMQAASDISLGWVRGEGGRDFYVRQLHEFAQVYTDQAEQDYGQLRQAISDGQITVQEGV